VNLLLLLFFAYALLLDNGGSLAVIAVAKSDLETEADNLEDSSPDNRAGHSEVPEGAITNHHGVISWAKVAVQNGVNVTVVNSPLTTVTDSEGDIGHQVIFSFKTVQSVSISN